MSITDDLFDLDNFIEFIKPQAPDLENKWGRVTDYIVKIERDNDELQNQNNQLKKAIKVMMGVAEESTTDNFETIRNIVLAWTVRRKVLLTQSSVDDLAKEIVRLLK